MPRIEFDLSPDDLDRLFAIKKKLGRDELTGNEFAQELLENELYRLHPAPVRYDDI